MKALDERKAIFYDNTCPSNGMPDSERFKIWDDGFHVGYINGKDDALNARECIESAARNADIQDAYESGYEDGVHATKEALKEKKPKEVSCLECAYFDVEQCLCDHEDGGYLSNPAKTFCQNFKR